MTGMWPEAHGSPSREGDAVARQRYEIRIKGRLGPTALAAFEDLDAGVDGHDTVLRGAIDDQSALYGVLARAQALGLELLAVRRVAVPAAGP